LFDADHPVISDNLKRPTPMTTTFKNLMTLAFSLAITCTACAELPFILAPDNYLDCPGELPEIPEVEAPGGGGVLEQPDASSVVFVVDKSCSMGWGRSSLEVPGLPYASPWQAAQYELTRAVDNLDAQARFSANFFNHSFGWWRPSMQDATEANKSSARSWVQSTSYGGGTTYIPPTAAAVNIGGGPPEVVMFLSDGVPSEGYGAVGGITAANGGRCVINTVAFGVRGSALQIMTDIATNNGGECRVVP
jgi:hypothetical protein